MEEGKHHGGEIVIRITPKNLERIVYILIIIGLLVTSIVGFMRTSPDCPEVEECEEVEETTTDDTDAEDDTETTDNSDSDNTDDDTTPTGSVTLSGEVEFLLTDVQLCATNSSDDKGQFESVTVYIKNGKERTIKTRVDLYLWDSNDDTALKQYPSTKVDKINILSGATLTRKFTVAEGKFSNKGMYTEIDKDKTIKAILIDTELNKKIGEITKTSVETNTDCD